MRPAADSNGAVTKLNHTSAGQKCRYGEESTEVEVLRGWRPTMTDILG